VVGGATFVAGTMAAYSDDIEQLPFDLACIAQWTFRQLDAEQAHNVGLWCAMHGLLPRERRPDPPSLRTTVWGRHFSSPIGECFTACPVQAPPLVHARNSGRGSSAKDHCYAEAGMRAAHLQDCLHTRHNAYSTWLFTECKVLCRTSSWL
jgi:hypothetical protein